MRTPDAGNATRTVRTEILKMPIAARTPTAKELVAARKTQTAAPAAVPAAPAATKSTAVAVAEYNRDYKKRYLDEVAPSGIAGRLVKFTKDGLYTTTDDEPEVPK